MLYLGKKIYIPVSWLTCFFKAVIKEFDESGVADCDFKSRSQSYKKLTITQ